MTEWTDLKERTPEAGQKVRVRITMMSTAFFDPEHEERRWKVLPESGSANSEWMALPMKKGESYEMEDESTPRTFDYDKGKVDEV